MSAETKNTTGIVGLAVSLVGTLLTCGILSPFGLIISIIGCFSKRRGAAITGAVVGAIGSAWLFTAGLSMVLTFFSVQQSIVGTAKKVEGAAGAAETIVKGTSDYFANPDKLADDAKRVIDKTKGEVDRAIGTTPKK